MKAKGGKVDVSLDWFTMLYQVLLGREKGPALRLLRCGVCPAEHNRHDRRGAGALGLSDPDFG
jgi:hypothetical protein